MTSDGALAAAARMGVRAGEGFLGSGVWPRCPFPSSQPELVAAWSRALFEVTGPAAPANSREPGAASGQ